jgi:FdhE protein
MPLVSIEARAEARWRDILTRRSDLAESVRLQGALVAGMLQIARMFEAHPPTLSSSRNQMAIRLAAGIPVLRGERIHVPNRAVRPVLVNFCDRLGESGAGDAALHVRETLETGRLHCGSLLLACLWRDQESVQTAASRLGLSTHMLWIVAELGAAPLAHILQQTLDASTDPADSLAGAVARWTHGYCAACGAWPVAAERVGTPARLHCSFCGRRWLRAGCHCIYCREESTRLLSSKGDPDAGLELCARCRGYVKVMTLPDPLPFPLLTIEDLATAHLDAQAIEHGFSRPPFPSWQARPFTTLEVGR